MLGDGFGRLLLDDIELIAHISLILPVVVPTTHLAIERAWEDAFVTTVVEREELVKAGEMHRNDLRY